VRVVEAPPHSIRLANDINKSNDTAGMLRDDTELCSNLEGLHMTGDTKTVTGVTTLLSDACESTEVLGKHYAPGKVVRSQPELQDLKEYFRRPRIIASGALPNSVRNLFNQWEFTSANIFSTWFPGGITRLLGVYGCKFKIVFTLQVASTPFHQGLLCLNWQYGTTAGSTVTMPRNKFSPLSTNIPHVRLDLAESTMAQLTVPFLYEFEFMPIGSNNTPPYGILGLNLLLPIPVVVGINAPTYKLLVHLEDLELIGASHFATSTVVAQAGRKMSPIKEEFENDAYPYSSTLHSASRTLGWIAKGIPSLASLTAPAAWFLDKSAGVLRSYGFAKPLVQDPPMRAQKLLTANEQVVDVPSTALMVAPFASNSLSVDAQFGGTAVDEMSLAFINSRWAQICVGSISTARNTGTVIYATGVGPSYFWFRTRANPPFCNVPVPAYSATGNNGILPSHLLFTSSCFKLWRGGFKFRFTFSKTKLHGGRMLVAYFPYSNLGSNTAITGTTSAPVLPTYLAPEFASSAPQPTGLSTIFDLRDSSIFEFEVPYSSYVPHMRFNELMGSLTMSVLDNVQATGVVSDTIDFMVEVCGGSDFELSVPIGPIFAASQAGTPVAQSGRVLTSTATDVCELTIGECVTSVKQLIMIPKWRSDTGFAGATYGGNVYPWWYSPAQSVLTPGPTSFPSETFGFGAYFSSAYNYSRGSTEVHAYAINAANSAGVVWIASMNPANNGAVPTDNSPNTGTGSNAPRVIATDNSALHVRFPSYQNIVRYGANDITSDWSFELDNVAKIQAPLTVPNNNLIGPTIGMITMQNVGVTTITYISRAAGEDGMLAHYLGPPTFILPGVVAASGGYDPDMVGLKPY